MYSYHVMKPDAITIFTDGSSRGNPGPGGFGAIVIAEGKVTELGGREERTTNNRMELMAAIAALSHLQNLKLKTDNIKLLTDSAYLVNGITKWVYSWEHRNWVTIDKKPVLNKDLWEQLMELVKLRKVEWKVVGGHIGVPGNMRCDEIATAFADNLPPKLYSGILEKYSIKNILDVREDAGLAAEKSAGKNRSNAKAYSYVSFVDGKVETHKTWAECEARVKGKPARFKKVLTAAEEAALIDEWSNAR